MGCTSSKEARRGHRRRIPPPYSRSQSLPVAAAASGVSSRKVVDSNRHVVALTSTTLGSLRLDSADRTATTSSSDADADDADDEVVMKTTNDIKNWSLFIETRIPKTLTEHETINTWELMEGLEEAEAEAQFNRRSSAAIERSLPFNNAASSPKPQWLESTPDDPIVSDFDPEILSNFRKALSELSPQHRTLLKSPEPTKKPSSIVKERISEFQQRIDAKRGKKSPPNSEKRVVIYFTSLRGVRKTYEDCWAVKVILQGYGVKVDERDVSMHGGFKDELNEILGIGFGGSRLPRVFANGKYLGGAEEVKAMHEVGELVRELEDCELIGKGGGGGGGGRCEGCGGVRFVPCETCSGSCKVFVEEDEEEEEVVVVGGGFRRCPDCNENGLVRCSYCL